MDQLSRPVQYPVYPKTPDYSLLDLATPLTVLHLGISTLSYFGSETCCIAKTLSTMPTSVESRRLVAFIPSRYGRVPSVTYATDCLVLRLGQIARAGRLALKENDIATVKPYIKALRALQESIDDEDMRISPETLCASELLGLFELLNGPSDVEKWMRHARGAAKLIELRGPDRFKTDFELSLFMTHTGPIITEAFLSRKTCFLGEERWQRVIHSAIRNDSLVPPEQAPLVIKLWASLSKGPNLFKEVESVILSPIPPAEERREGLIQVLIKEQENLKIWLAMAEEYQFGQAHQGGQGFARRATTLMWNYKTGRVAPERQVIWRVLQGTFFLCCLFKTRLLFAMAPSRFPELELICQALAKEVMAMGTDPSLERKESLVSGLFMSEIVWVAKGVIDTKEIWCEGLTKGRLEPSHDSSDMLEGWRFDAWCSAIGRKDR
ncbi:hypothetical protein GQ53DRAFT_650265 [Thozetella sp. PMI_491]|nr:hypothetical protein GQ53DRAFT_650265 [Thozetella sp. PMI_491]